VTPERTRATAARAEAAAVASSASSAAASAASASANAAAYPVTAISQPAPFGRSDRLVFPTEMLERSELDNVDESLSNRFPPLMITRSEPPPRSGSSADHSGDSASVRVTW
jgi:hypothetical protein